MNCLCSRMWTPRPLDIGYLVDFLSACLHNKASTGQQANTRHPLISLLQNKILTRWRSGRGDKQRAVPPQRALGRRGPRQRRRADYKGEDSAADEPSKQKRQRVEGDAMNEPSESGAATQARSGETAKASCRAVNRTCCS